MYLFRKGLRMNPPKDSEVTTYIDTYVLTSPIGKIVSREAILFDLTQDLGFPNPRTQAFRNTDFQKTRQTITQKMNAQPNWQKFDSHRKKSHRYGMAWKRIT
jgi:hypothetical protein